MKKLVLTLLGLTVAGFAAAEEIDRRMDAQPGGHVFISNLAGSVEVEGWNRNEVHVTGELGDDVEEFYFERHGDSIKIKVKVPDRRWGRKDVDSDLVVRIPAGSSLEVGTVSADIDVRGVRGSQKLEAVSGDVSTEGFEADVRASTVSGDLDVNGNGGEGEWDLTSVSGDIDARGLAGDIDLEVVSGDIDFDGGTIDDADLESVNGDITFKAALANGGSLDIESVNGSVDVEFRNDVSARFDIETFNGRIRNCFGPEAQRTSRHAPGWELEFTEGSGAGRVSIATLNGSVRICK